MLCGRGRNPPLTERAPVHPFSSSPLEFGASVTCVRVFPELSDAGEAQPSPVYSDSPVISGDGGCSVGWGLSYSACWTRSSAWLWWTVILAAISSAADRRFSQPVLIISRDSAGNVGFPAEGAAEPYLVQLHPGGPAVLFHSSPVAASRWGQAAIATLRWAFSLSGGDSPAASAAQ